MNKSANPFKYKKIVAFSMLLLLPLLFQNCADDFNVDEYGETVQQSTTEPAPDEPAPPPPAPPVPPPPAPAPSPTPPPPPAYQDYSGALGAADAACPNCAFENRTDTPVVNSCKVPQRFLVNNTIASVNQRCQELGWDYGQAQQVFSASEWCNYCNARTRTWNGTGWVFGNCVNGNVKTVRCFRN